MRPMVKVVRGRSVVDIQMARVFMRRYHLEGAWIDAQQRWPLSCVEMFGAATLAVGYNAD